MSIRRPCGAALALFLSAGFARAADPWELAGDDIVSTRILLRHGERQIHDLEGAPPGYDQDWYRVYTQPRHSYEARVRGIIWDDGCSGLPCPLFARVSETGTVLTPGVPLADDLPAPGIGTARGLTVRWTAAFEATEFLRATGDQVSPLDAEPYVIVFHDTTLLVPRWNASGSQTTVLLLHNARTTAATGSVHFYDGAGTLRATAPVLVPPSGTQVISTGGLPTLAGLSGAAHVVHDAGFGGLTGKAVALEPATGFTFDTPIAPVPY